MTPISKETDTIGMKISTKSVGWNRRNDITDEYKYLEGEWFFQNTHIRRTSLVRARYTPQEDVKMIISDCNLETLFFSTPESENCDFQVRRRSVARSGKLSGTARVASTRFTTSQTPTSSSSW